MKRGSGQPDSEGAEDLPVPSVMVDADATISERLPTSQQREHDDPPPNGSTNNSSCCGIGGGNRKSHSKAVHELENDSKLVKQLNKLTVGERQLLYEEIHGVAKVPQDPPNVDELIAKLQAQVKKIRRKATYDRAFFLSPRRVWKNRDFVVSFLRCEGFHVQRSAKRFAAFFDIKELLFGKEALVRDITFDDLDEDDLAVLKRGLFCLLPSKDRSGRRVVMFFNKMTEYKHALNVIRPFYLLLQHAQRDPETQRHGFVFCPFECLRVENFPDIRGDWELTKHTSAFFQGMPIKINAWHVCYDDPRSAPLLNVVKVFVGVSNLVRFKTHFGSHVECKYLLLGYGIPVKDIPVDDDGYLQHDKIQELLQDIQTAEAAVIAAQPNHRDYPRPMDIVCGRGWPFQIHDGNVELNRVVTEHWDEYNAGHKGTRDVLMQRLLEAWKAEGRRFLEKSLASGGMDDTGPEWVDVDDEKALEKIAHAFRNKPVREKYYDQKSD